jgi:hypothetical protein
VSTVHGVTGLESDDAGPAQLVEVDAQLSGGVAQTDIVVVVQLVNSLDLATNVQLLNSLVQVDDSGVLLVTTEDKLTLLLPKSGGKEYVSVQTH